MRLFETVPPSNSFKYGETRGWNERDSLQLSGAWVPRTSLQL